MKFRFKVNLFVVAFMLSCNSGFDKKEQKRIFLEVLNSKVISQYPKKIGSGFIVYPYYTDFDFNDFKSKKTRKHPSRKEIEKKVYSKLDIDENQFTDIRNKINLKYKSVYSELLNDLSIRDKSSIVITFSGMYEELIFVNLYVYNDSISVEDLSRNFDFGDNLSMVDSYVVLINSEKKSVQEIIFHDGKNIEFRLSQ